MLAMMTTMMATMLADGEAHGNHNHADEDDADAADYYAADGVLFVSRTVQQPSIVRPQVSLKRILSER